MQIKATTAGFFPRPEYVIEALQETEGRQKEGLGKGKKAEDAIERGRKNILDLQEKAGLDVLTEGQLHWDDLLADFAGRLKGVEMNGLLRFYDNNRYYRRPILKDNIEHREAVVEEFIKASDISDLKIKPIVPGPYTLLDLSEDSHYKNRQNKLEKLSKIINKELKSLEKAGCSIIQLDEPSLINENKKESIIEYIQKSIENIDAEVFINTYFGDIFDYYPSLLEIADGVGLDLISGEKNLKAIDEYGSSEYLQLGIMNSRNTRLETKDELKNRVYDVVEKTEPTEIHISPNCGLDFLPWNIMEEKIERLGESTEKIDNDL